jgi:hypothetical protein
VSVASLVAPAGAAVAADAPGIQLRPGMGGVPDLGAMRCGAYSKMHSKGQSGTRQATLYWFEGLVWARSGKTLDAFLASVPGGAAWNFETLTSHVLAWCEAHPSAQVTGALDDLWQRIAHAAPRPAG